jgi:cobalt-zinc-cadmium efflux system outer membrane protein
MRQANYRRWSALGRAFLSALGFLALLDAQAIADPPAAAPIPQTLTEEAAIIWALENNPELAAFRTQRGIAAAAVVIAETYPFNPLWEGRVRGDGGPASAGITNRVPTEHSLLTELEVRGQGTYRRGAANAALTRTEWEIAQHEILLSVRVIRSFEGVLYRQEKLDLLNETVELDQRTYDLVRKLVGQGRLHGPDEIVARLELDDVRAQLGPAQANMVQARYELRRALGAVDERFKLQGKLEVPLLSWTEAALMPVALERRPDRRARQAAMAEADAQLQLQRANRFGNPILGPNYEYDNTRVSYVGVQFSLPLPAFNIHRGEILEREAELERAQLDLRQMEVSIRQDVQSALARLDRANASVYTYRNEILKHLEDSVKEIEKLLEAGDPNVNILHVVETRRKTLKVRDGYLDALWELRQARADLAAAVGDPALAVLSLIPEDNKGPAQAPAK